MSFSPLILFSFPYVLSLTPLCDAELGSEASRAAEASWVEAQRLKEKAEASRVEAQCWKEKAKTSQIEARRWKEKVVGESHRLPPLFGLFSFMLNPILFLLAQSWGRSSLGQPRPLSPCRWCSRPRSGGTTR